MVRRIARIRALRARTRYPRTSSTLPATTGYGQLRNRPSERQCPTPTSLCLHDGTGTCSNCCQPNRNVPNANAGSEPCGDGDRTLPRHHERTASGAVAAFVTTPFDVGKTRRQVCHHTGGAAKDTSKGIRPEEIEMPKFLAHIHREEGAGGLFKGWAAQCLKIAPACAIMISCYELSKKFADDMNQ